MSNLFFSQVTIITLFILSLLLLTYMYVIRMKALKKKSQLKISDLEEAIYREVELLKNEKESYTQQHKEIEKKLSEKLTKIKLEILDVDFTLEEFLLYMIK